MYVQQSAKAESVTLSFSGSSCRVLEDLGTRPFSGPCTEAGSYLRPFAGQSFLASSACVLKTGSVDPDPYWTLVQFSESTVFI
jgi:hypothetical protein